MNKKILKEEIGRIKSMIKSINEGEFDGKEKKRFVYTNCNTEIEIEIGEDEYIYPEFEGYAKCESGAFYYEYGSIRGTHDPGEDCYVEDVDWNRDNFSEEENDRIEKYYHENEDKIHDLLIDDYMERRDG